MDASQDSCRFHLCGQKAGVLPVGPFLHKRGKGEQKGGRLSYRMFQASTARGEIGQSLVSVGQPAKPCASRGAEAKGESEGSASEGRQLRVFLRL